MELYIQVFFSGEKSPNIYCELTLFRHGLTEEKRRERSSVAILGFRKLPSQIWYWKRKEVNELTMWNPLVIIRCKLVKIYWRLGEGSMGTKSSQTDLLICPLEIFRMYYFITLLSSHSKNHLFLVMFFLRFLNPTPVCVYVWVCMLPHITNTSHPPAWRPTIQFNSDSLPRGSLRFNLRVQSKRLVEVQSYKTSPIPLSTSNANFQLRLLPILLTNCLWVRISANHLLGFD